MVIDDDYSKSNQTTMKSTLTLAVVAALGLGAANAALFTTFIAQDGTGLAGTTSGDTANAVGQVTLSDDTAVGDMWNGGDTQVYLHETDRVTGSFSAVVRIVGQTEAANGQWGKSGIQARDSLSPLSSSAMAQAAAGNGSQGAVPHRLAGKTGNDGQGGYEDPIQSGGVDVANDLFKADGSVTETWFQLRYDATTSGFSSGSAPDVAGAPGAWSWSAERTGVADTDAADGWYVGLAYSSHSDLSLSDGKEGLHGVTFDNFSITSIPEPSTALLGLSALGFLIRRKR